MSEQGEKTCPLCTEEMDLTDQQLKPCKCGYEICVWCWHHIMDMAEKDDTEGRCPACRTPYDKEKIVGMAEKCERLVAEVNSERKLKSQKSRPKTSEGRKHLSSVRVIQRNLVYIIGIPANLADEDLLQHKEYFGQYGKVLKVSISRTAGGAIQYSPTNTCSVYVTYSKEEEAVRCIHSVHGYFLDGKPLRACFGTTKYCHTWLRNMSCSNPDCLYLHEIGTQEDSFTKDEIISAYTRSRVQQITGATNNSQRRSGNTLPPPADEFCSSSPASSGKPITQTAPNIPASQVKGSPPNGTSGRSIALPAAAAWGLRVSNGRPPTPSSACSNGLAKQKPDAYNGLYPSLVASTPRGSTLNTDVGKKTTTVYEDSQVQHPNSSLGSLESSKQYIVRDSGTTIFDSRPSEVVQNTPLNATDSVELDRLSSSSASDKDGSLATNGPIQSICSGVSSIGIDSHLEVNHSDVIEHNNSDSNFRSFGLSGNQGMQQYYPEHVREPLIPLPSRKGAKESDGVSVSEETSDWRSKSPAHVLVDAGGRVEEDSLALDMRRLKISEGFVGHSSEHGGHADSGTMHAKVDETLHQYNDSLLSNGLNERKDSSSSELKKVFESASLFSNAEKAKFLGEFNNGATTADQGPEADMGESSIISSILSLGFDEWDDSLTSPNNLAKLLNETDGSVKISSSWKVQNNNQSRFSFARQEDSVNQGSDLEPPFSDILHRPTRYSVPQKSLLNRDAYFDDLRDGFSSSLLEESDNFSSSRSIISSNLLSASRPQVSAPPGFSVPSRAPPPGFSFQERMDQTFGSVYGNHFLESSSSPRNQYPTQPTGNFGSIADVEFIDPAILAVGKGRLPNGISNNGFDTRSAFTQQLSASSENDPRLQLLLQQSLSSHQNMRFPDHHIGDRFSPISDPYNNIPSRLLEQSQASNLSSPFAQLSLPQPRNAHMLNNGHWEGWNGIRQTRNDLGMAELIRNEGLGFNKHVPGYEDLKFRMPSSGDMYNNRAFGI